MAVPAVAVCKATKWYGRDSDPNRKMVLENLNMLVDKGNIYGLLGPSGCGKTTLLSCIVGRRRLNHGDIWVLGGRPGCKGSGVPGPRIGYMPQEIALVAEFSVKDAIFYFGRIFGMSTKQMEEKFQFLSDLLELPPEGRLLKNLSGGQQRRVSFAAALVQDPELLILDEPTVGLDPVLRDKIWEFLVQRANAGTTVIITTHYIEETRQAHKIGLLRDGQLLAEDAPESLLTKFGCDTLEDAFLTLAIRQQGPDRVRALDASSPDVVPERPMQNRNPNNYSSADDFSRMFNASTDALAMQSRDEISTTCPRSGSKKGRYKAVFIKSIQQFSRHPGGLIFSLLFPIVQVLAFFSAVGHDPTNLGLAMVNDEAALSPFGSEACLNSSVPSATPIDEETCDLYMLSCWFIEAMKQSNLYTIKHDSAESAQRAIRDGVVYAAIYVPANFSQALHERFRLGAEVDNATLDTSTISIWLDMSNHQISHFVKAELYHAYERFARRIMASCQRNPDLVQIPVNFDTPVYGTRDPKYTTFMAPGVMMTILFFLAAVITSTLMISDRLEGVWERSAVAGVRPHETLIVHVGIQSTVIVVQTLEMMVFAFVLYELPYKGPITTIGTLLFMQGLSGMCYGFLLSVCCSSYTLSFFIATGSFYPMILLCGILWPLEGMSIGLRYVAMALPFTIPSISLRDIMEKGYTIGDQEVYTGFLVTLTWIVATLSLCFLALRIRKN